MSTGEIPTCQHIGNKTFVGSYTEDLMQKGIKPVPIHDYEETFKSVAISQTPSSPCCRGKDNQQKAESILLQHFHSFLIPNSQSPITLSVCYGLHRSDPRIRDTFRDL